MFRVFNFQFEKTVNYALYNFARRANCAHMFEKKFSLAIIDATCNSTLLHCSDSTFFPNYFLDFYPNVLIVIRRSVRAK